jgi:hypothetical protein
MATLTRQPSAATLSSGEGFMLQYPKASPGEKLSPEETDEGVTVILSALDRSV